MRLAMFFSRLSGANDVQLGERRGGVATMVFLVAFALSHHGDSSRHVEIDSASLAGYVELF